MRGTKACYEHRADADISFLAKGQDRRCLPARLSMAKSLFAFLALSTPDHLLAAIVEPFLQVSLE